MKDIDDAIVSGIKNKREEALEDFWKIYGRLIWAVVKYHLKYFPRYQEECVQDILFSLWQNIDRYDKDKNTLKNWVGAVAKYKCIDYQRRYRNEFFEVELDEDIPDKKAFLEDVFEDDVKSILDCLKPQDRELFYRHYILGESVEDIAEKDKKRVAFFYNRLSRGRKKIRNRLAGRD